MVKEHMNGEGNLLSRTNYNVPVNMTPAVLEDIITKSAYYGAMSALIPKFALNLDNSIQQTEWMMPSGEDNDMHRRQKLTINGNTQWHTYNSTQELVNLVQAMTAASSLTSA